MSTVSTVSGIGDGPAAVADARRLLADHPVATTPDVQLRGLRFDAGLAFVHFDAGRGGRGLAPSWQPAVEEVFRQAGCPDWTARNVIGLGMAAPTLHAHGTPAQQALLRPLFTGEDIWCQLFSEPGAGSDLAGLATRAERDMPGWRVTGQKVWTTLAHVARWGLLLARTDPEQPKHRGLTYFVLDMHLPGVEVRPLRQLTGEAEFNEVYLDDVLVPEDALLGGTGAGWRVAMTTLMNERVSLGGRTAARGSGPIGQAVDAYRQAAAAGRCDGADLDRLMRLWTRVEAARLTNARAADMAGRGTPGPEGSIAKLQMAELNKAVYDLATEFAGPAALLADYAETRPDFAAVHGGSGNLTHDYLRSLANSIEGGTSEILRNVLGERVLGLAGEPRTDKDVPWTKVLKS